MTVLKSKECSSCHCEFVPVKNEQLCSVCSFIVSDKTKESSKFKEMKGGKTQTK